MRIRKFRAEDSKAASRVMTRAFMSFLGARVKEKDLHYFFPAVLRKVSFGKGYGSETVSYVAVEGAKVIGYVRLTASKTGLGSLEVIGVDPDYFGTGAGERLMQASEKYWKRKNMRKISTCVSAHNARALVYYVKHGFIPEGYRRDHFREGIDEIILGKFLKKRT
jgi:ribosomal protein S18 acetylase RimI-like enzyme